MTEQSVMEIPIASIRIAGRYRKDHGDIASLRISELNQRRKKRAA